MKVQKNISNAVARMKMHQSEEKYRLLIENMNLGLLEVDLDEKIRYANRSFCEMVGYQVDELEGKIASHLLLMGKDIEKMVERNEERKEDKLGVYEMQIQRKDGEKVWMLISAAPLKNERGEIIGSIGIHLDITSRKFIEMQRMQLIEEQQMTQRSLGESEARMRAIIDSALDAVITINNRGQITEWNQQAEKIFGYTNKESVGKSLTETIIPPKYRDAHQKGMAHHARTGEGPVLNKRIEITALHKDGREFPIELSIAPIKIEGQFFYSAFLRDITLEKESKQEMEKALAKEKELSELKTKFVTMTSHEFRTPLTTIQTNVELLSFKMDKRDPELRSQFDRNFQRIDSEVKRLTGLMNDVLILGRIESGKLELAPAETDLVAYCKDVLSQNFTHRADQRKVRFKTTGKAQSVMIDPNLFSHIIINLLSNAFKYDKSNDPTLELKFRKGSVELNVKDKGIGIPEGENESLFNSFFRASNVENIQGTGLGLSIVRQFVEMHGGQITAQSEPGKGATFTVTLNL